MNAKTTATSQPREAALGALVGLCLTAALLAVLFVATGLFGTPFPPYTLFDWLARALPGAMVTFGIDAMVSAIRALNIGNLSDTAKTAERLLATSLIVVIGTLAGAAVFLASRSSQRRGLGISAGAAIGILLAAAALALGGSIAGAGWTLLAFLLWGATLGWTRERLRAPDDATRAPVATAATRAEPDDDAGRRLPRITIVSQPIDRRTFVVRLAGASAVITVAGAAVGMRLSGGTPSYEPGELWSANNALPPADLEPAPGTRPEFTPLAEHYRIDINTSSPVVDPEQWRLRVTGLVERPLALTLDELRAYEQMHLFVTLACISNPIAGDLIGTTRWTGVSLQRLLPDLALDPAASHLHIASADGFFEILPLDVARADERVMIAYAWDGVPLPREHGFPLRLYIPDRYGMKQPKWIDSIEATSQWEPGYWVQRGWSREARMRTTSVIDTVAERAIVRREGGPPLVPIGGMAHAGARGISRVEIRVDEGAWRPAQLRRPLSELTWVLWRYDWPFQEGRHTFTVRAFESDGTPQIAEESSVRPDGATRLHDVRSSL
jgi:DMSO/TMAO reductase YedYZ molybdopterin-dependent catalytic subunit